MFYEHHSEPLLARRLWIRRVLNSVWLAVAFVAASLAMGVAGYMFFGHLTLINAILEASMILGGMGAVAPMTTDSVKLFASFYALFSGMVAITVTALILGPWIHRLMHGMLQKNFKR